MQDFQILDWQVNDYYPEEFVQNALGPIPLLVAANDFSSITEQLGRNLAAGFRPVPPGHGILFSEDEALIIPGLPSVAPVAYALHGLEKIYVYPAQWVVIAQLNGSFQAGRIV